jgi:uncharacterized protein YbcC (UPF0753/DUF2309 family)
VFISAPRESIDSIVVKHAVVRDLVGHGWLHLLRIDPEQSSVEQRREGRWVTVAAPSAATTEVAATVPV